MDPMPAVSGWAWTEGAIVLAVLSATLFPLRRAIVGTFRAVPSGYAAACCALGILIVGGQVVNDSTATFPFVEWSMYTNRNTDPKFVDYTVERRSGREERLLIARTFSLAKVRRRLEVAVDILERSPSDATAGAEIDALLHAVVQEDRARNATDPPRVVHIWRARLRRQSGDRPASFERTLITDYVVR